MVVVHKPEAEHKVAHRVAALERVVVAHRVVAVELVEVAHRVVFEEQVGENRWSVEELDYLKLLLEYQGLGLQGAYHILTFIIIRDLLYCFYSRRGK